MPGPTPVTPPSTAAEIDAGPAAALSSEPSGEGSARPELGIAAVYREHHAYVYRVLGRLGLRGSELDDGLQDVFLVVHQKLAEFEHRAALRTWIYAIALRVARRHRERAAKSREREQSYPEALPSSQPDPEAQAQQREALARVDAALARLPEEQREVFVLAEIESLRGPEIAAACGVKLNTVYSRLRLARTTFARAIKQRTPSGPSATGPNAPSKDERHVVA